ncbi:unnamed protein product [Cylindrotheca closterium]|uniref:Uncharacterized protein n=1 Tax=Cylindrotheca closterium TaxID=2856 RepID=A0AAD2CTP6_9STRA|nr:unnamed protein product [Cylindrotheca closterium]
MQLPNVAELKMIRQTFQFAKSLRWDRNTTSTRTPPPIYDELWFRWAKGLARQNHDNSNIETVIDMIDWNRILETLQSDSSLAKYTDDERQGMHLLHFVCALHPPGSVLELLLKSFPNAIFVQSANSGIIPLMIACGSNAASEIIETLLKHDTSGSGATLRITDTHGFSAVHWACREDVSSRVLQKLLLFDPMLAELIETNGSRHKITHVLFQGGRKEMLSDNQDTKLRFLLLARFKLPLDEAHFLFALHASVALECQFPVWNYLLAECATMGVDRDPFGNLPLHYAVQQKQHNIGEPTKQQWSSSQLLERVLRLSPEAASSRNRDGELPLSASLKSGFVWDKGIQALFHAYPEANCLLDPVTKLHPFCLAASFCHDLATTFMLLRQNPEHVLQRYGSK